MTDQPDDQPNFAPFDPDYDVSGFMAQLNDIVSGAAAAQGDDDSDDAPDVTVLELPKSALANLLSSLGMSFLGGDRVPDETPWETLVESQFQDALDFLPTAPRMTVVTWLIGDYNLQWARRQDAESRQEHDQCTERMCLHLARLVAVARFDSKKYRPDYSRTHRGHKKTVDLLLKRTYQHRWSDMGDVAAQRLYTLMGGGR